MFQAIAEKCLQEKHLVYSFKEEHGVFFTQATVTLIVHAKNDVAHPFIWWQHNILINSDHFLVAAQYTACFYINFKSNNKIWRIKETYEFYC